MGPGDTDPSLQSKPLQTLDTWARSLSCLRVHEFGRRWHNSGPQPPSLEPARTWSLNQVPAWGPLPRHLLIAHGYGGPSPPRAGCSHHAGGGCAAHMAVSPTRSGLWRPGQGGRTQQWVSALSPAWAQQAAGQKHPHSQAAPALGVNAHGAAPQPGETVPGTEGAGPLWPGQGTSVLLWSPQKQRDPQSSFSSS